MNEQLPRSRALTWLVLGLVLLVGLWMAFDGLKALTVGDYVTPKSGRFAGQLGPWAQLRRAVGLEPRSMAVKLLHVLYGLGYSASGALYLVRGPAMRKQLVVAACLGLWYLPFGTLLNLLVVGLVLARDRLSASRRSHDSP